MKHLGDITKIRGDEVPCVNVIIGGSPCQDLSVAGKRAGLAGERSGLFMEMIRIIKEMREKNNGKPRFMVWENVPGSFSSNGGADFGAVLEEIIRVVREEVPAVPRPRGGWPTAGCLRGVDGGWSVAWRVLDAQFWGVPQRRRRIALIADFAGMSAPEILFEREGVCGDSAESGTAREGAAGDASVGVGSAGGGSVWCLQGNGIDRADTAGCNGKGWKEGVSYTLNTIDRPAVAYSVENHPNDSRIRIDESGKVQTLSSRMETGGGNIPLVMEKFTGDSPNVVCIGNGQADGLGMHEKAGTLNCMHDQQIVCISRESYNCGQNSHGSVEIMADKSFALTANVPVCAVAVDCRNGTESKNNGTILANSRGGGLSLNNNQVVRAGSIVRRLTPLECERLQGFPDGWTDIGEWTDSKGKVHKESSDTARYKALGNSIALPPWKWVLERLAAYCPEDRRMASLFDGIGGFPLIWETICYRGSCIWASEIEEFPMAVTKRRFGEEDNE